MNKIMTYNIDTSEELFRSKEEGYDIFRSIGEECIIGQFVGVCYICTEEDSDHSLWQWMWFKI
jgi:hypothetical protein